MYLLLPLPLLFLTGVSLVTANVEKTIFLGPEPVNIPQHSPSLSDLHIDVLTPGADDNDNNNNWSLRSHVQAIFPTDDLPRGKETWLLLDHLTEGQRYEVRVCWLATQPTAFHLETFSVGHVFETPELIISLYNHSMSRQTSSQSSSSPSTSKSTKQTERQSSVLFLRLSAAADYFTMNSTLMDHPEPVLTDIILDPFLFNILPRTLVPTVGFVVFVALVSWILGVRVVRPWLTALVQVNDDGSEKKKTQ